MKIIEAIKNYIGNLDCMKTFENAININFLDGTADNFSIEEVPCNPILKKYLDGSTKRQFKFAFCSRQSYGSEVIQNIDNSGFYEEFIDEIEVKSYQGILPMGIDSVEALKLEVTSSAYVVSANSGTDEDTALYQINLCFKYLKK
nr:chloramphenicol resistance protein [Clostridium neonatale]